MKPITKKAPFVLITLIALSAVVLMQLNFKQQQDPRTLDLNNLIQKAEACADVGGGIPCCPASAWC
ncbi:MAG: hypothetical protein ABIS36_06570 [Chryseolinea sp.]